MGEELCVRRWSGRKAEGPAVTAVLSLSLSLSLSLPLPLGYMAKQACVCSLACSLARLHDGGTCMLHRVSRPSVRSKLGARATSGTPKR